MTDNNIQIQTFSTVVGNLCTDLMSWQDSYLTQQENSVQSTETKNLNCPFQQEIASLLELKKDFSLRKAHYEKEGQQLSIGIIGQVKAGKSSFLNALLFDDQWVLPVAATPKTANLTRMTYGATPLLKVSFYTPQEWADIEANAASAGQHVEARIARELVKMAAEGVAKHGINITETLAQGSHEITTKDVAGLMGLLNQYAGEDGQYTALVKATELYLPHDELKGFEVVDTPGMNDPVLSRTQKTRDYMAKCDVVFFLSRCSQFLDQSDMELLALQLPSKGVKRMVLVAGQFDSAILDDGFNRDSLTETETNLRTRLGRRAKEEMGKLAHAQQLRGQDYVELADLLTACSTPIFASTFAHGFATYPPERWGESMQHVYGEFEDLVQDQWNGTQITQEDWLRLGNFEALRAAYQIAREDKQTLLAKQLAGLLPEAQRNYQDYLKALIERVKERSLQLRIGDINEIAQQQSLCERRINSISGRLAEVLNKYRDIAEGERRKSIVELQKCIAEYSTVKARTGTETESHSREVSTSRWYNPFSWGDTETVYYTTSSNYEYLMAADAIEQVVNFGNVNAANLQQAFNNVVSPAQLKIELRKTLLAELDTSSEGFDPGAFRSTLENTLNKQPLPTSLKLDLGDSAERVSRQFRGEITDNQEMSELRLSLQKALQDVLQRLLASFEDGVINLCKQLDNIRDALANELAHDLRQELESLKVSFANKEQELNAYNVLLSRLER